MEELEISTERQMEDIHHHAEHANERWLLHCALLSAVLAVLAAISGLYSSHYANEAMIEQIHASDHWGYYQAKGMKAMIAEMHADQLKLQNQPLPQKLQEKMDKYPKEQEEIKEQATEEETQSAGYLHQHEALAKAVTAFQVSIAVTAMAAICKRKHFLILTACLAVIGTYFMAFAFAL